MIGLASGPWRFAFSLYLVQDETERFATPRVAAGVIFRDELGRVLLVKPTYKQGWDIPGGYVEIGESPRDAAIREVREELGISWSVGAIIAVDWAPHPDEGDKLLFLFTGETLTNEDLVLAQLNRGELESAAFFQLDDVEELMQPRLARRLRAALDGLSGYLERGEPRGIS